MKTKFYCFFTILIFLTACSSSEGSETFSAGDDGDNGDDGSNPNSEWLIPVSEVKDGGPGKDGIPSIDSPIFINPEDETVITISDDDLIVGYVDRGQAKAIPHYLLDWHEIVNDNTDIVGESITISYCPLTGTAFGWESTSGGMISTYGVSGLLYNTNLIMYDRNTDSNWSQMRLQCVNGELIGETPTILDVLETNWATWRQLYPDTKIMSANTGFDRAYGFYPYGNYKEDHNAFLFTPSPMSDLLPNKQRVFAIIKGERAKAYQFSSFENGNAIKDNFGGKNYLVVGNENAITAFELNGVLNSLTYEFQLSDSGRFFIDNEGTVWDIFGKAISGPRAGQQLQAPSKVTSMWFAVAAFYPSPTLHQ